MNNCNSDLWKEKHIKGSSDEIPPRKATDGKIQPCALEKTASELPWRWCSYTVAWSACGLTVMRLPRSPLLDPNNSQPGPATITIAQLAIWKLKTKNTCKLFSSVINPTEIQHSSKQRKDNLRCCHQPVHLLSDDKCWQVFISSSFTVENVVFQSFSCQRQAEEDIN